MSELAQISHDISSLMQEMKALRQDVALLKQHAVNNYISVSEAAKTIGVSVQAIYKKLYKCTELEPDVDYKQLANGRVKILKSALPKLKRKNG